MLHAIKNIDVWILETKNFIVTCTLLFTCLSRDTQFILRLHYVPGGHGGHVSDNREQNGITVRQRRGTG